MLSYAEIHFRPSFVPSLIYKKQPEIVFDAPIRVEPEYPIPVFIIIKDADKFPVEIDSAVIHASYEGGIERVARFPYGSLQVDTRLWWDSINIFPEYSGIVKINPYLLLKTGGKQSTVHVDNYRGISHSPLKINVASSSYPGTDGWYHGDIHCHTYYTSDQVEFGAPIETMAFAAHCMGMQWMAVTDHSYDLDDREDNYLIEDPFLLKWRSMKQKAEALNESLTVIPGEEVSCSTQNGYNCHLLAINSEKFIKGSGDSGERGFDTKTENSIGEAVSACLECGGIACAAHPLEKIPFLERVLLRRGQWTLQDIDNPGITAIQFFNGVRDSGFRDGMNAWIYLLLKGRRLYTFGGSDAHGDMNRCRQLSIPLLSVTEKNEHMFGTVRTVVRAKSKKSVDLLTALKEGKAVVTDGPFIDIEAYSGNVYAQTGCEIPGGKITVRAGYSSSSEFGYLKKCRIFVGVSGEMNERVQLNKDFKDSEYEYNFTDTFEVRNLMYIRADCETVMGKICFTNPIWVQQ